jgi:phosphoglycerate dehydrogenase-like enzyme
MARYFPCMHELRKIAILDDYHHVAQSAGDWGQFGAEVAIFDRHIAPEQLAVTLREFDTLILMRERSALPQELLEQLPNLKLIVTTGMQNASVDTHYLSSHEIPMLGTGVPGYQRDQDGVSSTVEVAWALIFALFKRVTREDHAIRQGIWQQGLPTNLQGATLGLLGLGRLGSQMVAPAKAFGMDVVAWSRNLTEEQASERGARLVGKDELFRDSDVISIHMVLGDRSRGLVTSEELALMKDSAFIVNTSRGPIIDHDALVEALQTGTIAGAGLDVYDTEPISDSDPLLSCENTVLSPHLGYVSHETLSDMYAQVIEDLQQYQAGTPVRVVV